MKEGKTVQAAARELAAEKRIKGNVTEGSLAMRLACFVKLITTIPSSPIAKGA